MSGVLVLNASYEPLHIVSVRRAVVLVWQEKAELVEAAEQQYLRGINEAFPLPLVIRLLSYVRLPHRLTLPLNRRNLFIRDGFTCQYCGRQPGRAALTMDHVIPRSRGGLSTWENVVAACPACNQRKGARLPQECGMVPSRPPVRPRYQVIALLGDSPAHHVWANYLPD